jgi:hypothetical protein
MGGEHSTVVKHFLYQNPKVKGSRSAIAAGTGREKSSVFMDTALYPVKSIGRSILLVL